MIYLTTEIFYDNSINEERYWVLSETHGGRSLTSTKEEAIKQFITNSFLFSSDTANYHIIDGYVYDTTNVDKEDLTKEDPVDKIIEILSENSLPEDLAELYPEYAL